MLTLSPTLRFLTFGPNETTSPEHSKPGISVAPFGGGYIPDLYKEKKEYFTWTQSGLFILVEATFINTSSDLGIGVGLVLTVNTSGPP